MIYPKSLNEFGKSFKDLMYVSHSKTYQNHSDFDKSLNDFVKSLNDLHG